MKLTQSYEIQRDLLTGMAYHRGTTLVANRQYSYDTLGRPTARNTSRQGTVKNDTFGYNNRSELTSATVNGSNYAYDYDNIGNRETATESEITTNYTANELNQYTAIGDFTPTFDADGNQTLVKTSTGTWAVTYDAENRPVTFTNTETNTVIECTYDHMGRRATKKVTIDGNITLHQRYLYRGYLQIDSGAPHCAFTLSGQTLRVCPTGLTAVVRFACCDLTRSNHPALWLITWDPTQPIATRPLAIQKDATWYSAPARLASQDSRSQECSRLGVWLLKSHPAYGWDLTKNICELYGSNGYIRTAYTYTPYGSVTESGNTWQPIQWSSEYNDTELGLVYYNYRHYNSVDGRWINIDPIYEQGGVNLYSYARNWIISGIDNKGTSCFDCCIVDHDPWSYIAGKLFSFLSGQLYPKTWVAKVLRKLNRNKEADKILSSLKNPKISRMTTLPSSISLYFRLGARSGLRILGRVMAPINILMISIDSMIFGYCTWHCMWNDCYDGSKDNLGNKIKDKIDSFLKTFNPTE